MRCLHCGLELTDEAELRTGWHKRCVRRFFGTEELPVLDVTEEQLEQLAVVGADKGFTIPGVQKKMSLHLERDNPARLTLINYPVGYILKPQAEEYKNLPEFEYLAMRMAEVAGVKTVPFALFRTAEGLAYITKRVDRDTTGGEVRRYAMEDFCQLSERLAEDKYKGSYEGCVRIVREYSEMAGLDVAEVFLRVVTSFVVGNSDMHLKNFSLIEGAAGGRDFRLSEAYDILPVNVVEPRDLDEVALSLNGRKRGLKREDFLAFAQYCELGEGVGEKMVQRVCELENEFMRLVGESFLNEGQQGEMRGLIGERVGVLRG